MRAIQLSKSNKFDPYGGFKGDIIFFKNFEKF